MKLREHIRIGCEAVAVGLCFGLLNIALLSANGQQPGDTPAPDVFESGLLTASITCPETVRAGAIIAFDVSGTSDGETDLTITPHVPQDAVVLDSGGTMIYVAIVAPGRYEATWKVESEDYIAGMKVRFTATGPGVPIPPKPPEPGPEDSAFTRYVRELLADVEADTHSDVSEVFRGIAKRIDAGELRTSKPIETATVRALFGPKAETHPEWAAFWLNVWDRMLNGDRLMSAEQWAKAYRETARAIAE